MKTGRLAITVVGAMALLTACTSPDNGQAGDNDQAASGQLEEVLSSGELRVGIIPDNPPSSLRTGDADWEGYDVDIAERLADSLGAELTIVSTTGADRVTAIQSDNVDVVISTFSPTNERAQSITFTEPYSASGTTALFAEDLDIDTFSDVADYTSAFARGGTADTLMGAEYPDADVTRFDNIADAFQALESGQADVLLEDMQIVNELAEDNPGYATLDEEPQNLDYLNMGISHGDPDWLNYLNNFIRSMHVSGDTAELYEEWYGSEMPELYDY